MDTVKLNDKYFKIFIDRVEIEKAVKEMAVKINEDCAYDIPLFLSVLNGSFMFTSDLLKNIHIPCELSFVKLASYSGLGTTGKVNELIGLNESIKGRNVIILEDIVDTGITLEMLIDALEKYEVKSIKVATLLFKPKAYQKSKHIDYIGIEVGNEFLVGYGLDYNARGRNLADIYKIID
jgi:hypoxanthine phosphoribosyltransferase